MARSRSKRGMGPLLKELRTNPVAAVVNGVLAAGGILSAGWIALWMTYRAQWAVGHQAHQVRLAVAQQSLLLYLGLGSIFLLGGVIFLLFALVQITTSIRVFDKGLVWRRFGKKRVVRWVEVQHFGPGDATALSLTSWRMVLYNGEVIVFHSILYNSRVFAETMELMAEQIEETHKQLG